MKLAGYIPYTKAWRYRRHVELCRQAVDRMQEIVDGEVPNARAAAVLEKHLHACESCNAEADVIRDLKTAIARVGQEDTDQACVEKLKDLGKRLCDGQE